MTNSCSYTANSAPQGVKKLRGHPATGSFSIIFDNDETYEYVYNMLGQLLGAWQEDLFLTQKSRDLVEACQLVQGLET